jgi:hypothetical protein
MDVTQIMVIDGIFIDLNVVKESYEREFCLLCLLAFRTRQENINISKPSLKWKAPPCLLNW